jgi:hypothetical protein
MKVKIWEENWLGPSSLAIQYWKLYVIMNENNKFVHDLWDGTHLKCNFSRTIDFDLYRMWEEVVQLLLTINFSNESDEMVWAFSSNGVYSSQSSLYKITNHKAVQAVFLPAIGALKIPPRVHFFLWL